MNKVKVVVPATSANFGPGFDCLGIAFNMFNSIEVEEKGDGLSIEVNSYDDAIPRNENNIIYKSMKRLFEKVDYIPKGIKIKQFDNIPVTKGLGSSSACIVAGLLAANSIVGNKFSVDEIALMAAECDGHPDNTTPAIYGGFVAAAIGEGMLHKININVPNNMKFVAFVPDFTLPTVKARMVLPQLISHKDATYNLARLSLLISSLQNNSLESLRFAIDDKLHQPYRKRFIPDIEKIFDESYENGAKGCYMSGAGPTLIAVLDSKTGEFCTKMESYFEKLNSSWDIIPLEVNKTGAEVFVE